MAHFISGYGNWFSSQAIDQATSQQHHDHWTKYSPRISTRTPLIGAIDLAIEDDSSFALYGFANRNYSMEIIHADTYFRDPPLGSETHKVRDKMQIIDHLVTLRDHGLKCYKFYVDVSRDEVFADLLKEKGFHVIPIKWSAVAKVQMMTHARDCLEAQLVELPPYDQTQNFRTLHQQLRVYNYAITEFQHVQFNRDPDKKGRRKKFDDDGVSAFAMLCQHLSANTHMKSGVWTPTSGGSNRKWDYSQFSKAEKTKLSQLSAI